MEGYDGADMHLSFADIFRKQNNLSRELTALQALHDRYPEQAAEYRVAARLFEIYTDIDRDKALVQWDNLDVETQSQEPNLDRFFKLNKWAGLTNRVDSLADVLLKINPKHVEALEWNAEKYYQLAETRYQREMAKYNANRTHVQYTFLLNALKRVTQDFITSRDYFERLWEMDKDKRYAAFLANIYTRLDNPQRADIYRKQAE
jgi:hypothetical protein